MKFRVYGNATVVISTVVEAETRDEAIEKAYEEFGGIGGFCGNGGTDKLIGVTGEHESIEADCEVEFTDAEESDE